MFCVLLTVLGLVQHLNGFHLASPPHVHTTRVSMSSVDTPLMSSVDTPLSMVPTNGLVDYIGRTSELPDLVDESGYVPQFQSYVEPTKTQKWKQSFNLWRQKPWKKIKVYSDTIYMTLSAERPVAVVLRRVNNTV
jgi:hypothetical protein